MASTQSTVDYLLEQISDAGILRYQKMFGEYAIYLNEKVVGFVCDDQLYIKPTAAGREFIDKVEEAPPYPGAKMYFYISGDLWENREWMTELVLKTAKELPLPKPKKKRKK
jgi:TfoX/Sxy family transcriptional regulator of competence genes